MDNQSSDALQQSAEVAAQMTHTEAHLLVLLIIMLLTGALAGVVNFYLRERGGRETIPQRYEWVKYVVLGIASSLTVPLFLNMISSNLMEAPKVRRVDYFVFAGFCLLYVIALRRQFENVANRLLAQVETIRKDVSQLRSESHNAIEQIGQQASEAMKTASAKESLSYIDIQVIRAVSDVPSVYGDLAALVERTGLARDVVNQRLSVLKHTGLLETRIDDKHVLHWYVSAKGKQLLSDILGVQDEKRGS